MAIKKDHIKAVSNWLKNNQFDCPVCKEKGSWRTGEMVAMEPAILNPSKINTGVNAMPLACGNCGYLVLLSAAALGLSPSVSG